ncbi:DNA-directed RNA polymerase ii subunit grinl1a-like [Plakobranchus ocellatus]|uniref:DNA-directed RNA polymerase ii subunit grinl1a-like n=1 Tax=Plakobranchus ocellatus TaxID=259542 RepID=A0AAV4E2M3_9GAST|nr:DNA-directed RNA polymerase ii subunit grinl1a-like [Plakobranchus ocellatus]
MQFRVRAKVAMNLSQDRQGYIGDLTIKTLSELKDLLDKKEKLLANRSLLQKLPDKGKKVHEFVQKVKELIEKKSLESALESGNNQRLNMVHQSLPVIESVESVNTTITDQMASRDIHIDNKSSKETKMQQNLKSSDTLSDDLQKLSLGTEMKHLQTGQTSVNAYEKIIQRDNESLNKEASKFMPHRTLKSKDHHHPVPDDTLPTKMESHRFEESAVHPPQYKHQKSKLISLNESIHLIEEHQKRNEELAIERATKRLMSQSTVKMEMYNPSSIDMNYREQEGHAQVDLDSDDDSDDD